MAKPVDNTVRDSVSPLSSDGPVPRVSGFHSHSAPYPNRAGGAPVNSQPFAPAYSQPAPVTNAGEAIRLANAELEQQAGHHLTIPLTVAVAQRDHAVNELWRERQAWQQELARQTALFAAQIQERDTQLNQLRQQLHDTEREAAWLREAAQLRSQSEHAAAQVTTETAPSSESGEYSALQVALEAAWQDVQEARSRLGELEGERDQAVKEADELRVELYDKLAAAQDEAIEAEGRLTDAQRAFDEAKESWETDQARLRNEVEDTRQALVTQLEVNTQLRQSLLPQVHTSAAGLEELPAASVPSFGTTQPVPLVNPSQYPPATLPRPPVSTYTAEIGNPAPTAANFAMSHVPPAPAPPGLAQQPRTLSSLVGFDTSVPEPNEETDLPSEDVEEALGKRKSFGFGRLFRSK